MLGGRLAVLLAVRASHVAVVVQRCQSAARRSSCVRGSCAGRRCVPRCDGGGVSVGRQRRRRGTTRARTAAWRRDDVRRPAQHSVDGPHRNACQPILPHVLRRRVVGWGADCEPRGAVRPRNPTPAHRAAKAFPLHRRRGVRHPDGAQPALHGHVVVHRGGGVLRHRSAPQHGHVQGGHHRDATRRGRDRHARRRGGAHAPVPDGGLRHQRRAQQPDRVPLQERAGVVRRHLGELHAWTRRTRSARCGRRVRRCALWGAEAGHGAAAGATGKLVRVELGAVAQVGSGDHWRLRVCRGRGGAAVGGRRVRRRVAVGDAELLVCGCPGHGVGTRGGCERGSCAVRGGDRRGRQP
mmetsp:Transcript_11062/g.34239  ORF Transcript_11062/g.34239 Transcript_11062/m.34239 type:complete len:352 (+) Transcript_11062:784-1839(+)